VIAQYSRDGRSSESNAGGLHPREGEPRPAAKGLARGMPPVSHTHASSGPGHRLRSATDGVRFDRLGRTALLVGFLVLFGFYASAGLRMWTARADSIQRREAVVKLQNERTVLLRERKALGGQLGVATQARRLGMVLPGEVPFVITGLPGETH